MKRFSSNPPRGIEKWQKNISQDIVNGVINLVLEAYYQLLPKRQYSKYPIEDILRNDLYEEMRSIKTRIGFQCLIGKECAIVNKKTSLTKGRIDIALFFDNDEEKYFSFECKRVSQNEWTKDIRRLYIKKGLMDFVNLKYSEKNNVGGMIAFVEEGDYTYVFRKIKESTKDAICCCSEDCVDCTEFDHKFIFKSKHNRSNGSNIDIYHILLDLSKNMI